VIGERERRHVEGLRARDEVAKPRKPVEQAVLTVGVQVDELSRDAIPLGPSEEAPRLRQVYEAQ
jgi:hypothetical protein